ncbi:carbohydrate ABC transporter permease [Sphaerisporangium sp. TRM90804]|uniref:carbohydrate ABC transporter permease n=1 Tax=Sphaerisporangium sp. TRM90804 TaxID=3031113 RepID=UPI00244924EA|nr:carbohydrate ABC transporter permease [Sphaerisporangium sp. TRM90804]MDH2430659.1 carbohydrate ABC transporter permease [Sphaerisporangium sp. TRM90804]
MTARDLPARAGRPGDGRVRHSVAAIGRATFLAAVTGFFALPMLWLASAPFDAHPTITTSVPELTLANFRALLANPYLLSSLGNSVLQAAAGAVLVVTLAATAAYALSRVRIPGRDALLYLLLLLSSVVTGTAAMVPIFELATRLNLIDTHLGVVLTLSGGLLPAAIFILKDFMDGTPTSYEESARVFGARPLQILWHIVVPVIRPGLATIAVWTVASVWGSFLTPFILLRDPAKAPGAVILYTLYTEGGAPRLDLISAFSLLYSLPVVLMYLFVSRKYGFRFHGGIKR